MQANVSLVFVMGITSPCDAVSFLGQEPAGGVIAMLLILFRRVLT